jgi:hypothetical protein
MLRGGAQRKAKTEPLDADVELAAGALADHPMAAPSTPSA